MYTIDLWIEIYTPKTLVIGIDKKKKFLQKQKSRQRHCVFLGLRKNKLNLPHNPYPTEFTIRHFIYIVLARDPLAKFRHPSVVTPRFDSCHGYLVPRYLSAFLTTVSL